MMVSQFDNLVDYELNSCTTLKIGGKAEVAYAPLTVGDFVECVKLHAGNGDNINFIGAGSNLLIASEGVKGITFLTRNLKDIIAIDDNRIYSMCGVKSASFSKVAYEAGLSGAEFLIGIPGSIGGAIFMNAGAHGQNIKDIIESVKVLNLKTFEVDEIPANQLEFSYRTSSFAENECIILSAIFNLPKGDSAQIKEKMDFHVNYRAKNHPPLTEYSAGSTFRNPEGDYAANLLEKVGAKEYIENNRVRFSTKHANFLYNFNDATSTDVVRLMYKMWTRVYEQFGVKLHPEIKFIGNRTDEENQLWQIMINS